MIVYDCKLDKSHPKTLTVRIFAVIGNFKAQRLAEFQEKGGSLGKIERRVIDKASNKESIIIAIVKVKQIHGRSFLGKGLKTIVGSWHAEIVQGRKVLVVNGHKEGTHGIVVGKVTDRDTKHSVFAFATASGTWGEVALGRGRADQGGRKKSKCGEKLHCSFRITTVGNCEHVCWFPESCRAPAKRKIRRRYFCGSTINPSGAGCEDVYSSSTGKSLNSQCERFGEVFDSTINPSGAGSDGR